MTATGVARDVNADKLPDLFHCTHLSMRENTAYTSVIILNNISPSF
jgi:hypothetical protein